MVSANKGRFQRRAKITMNRILIVGCGQVGRSLLKQRAGQAHFLATARRQESSALARALGARPLPADLDSRASLTRLGGVAHWVVHLAPPPGEGMEDDRTRRLIAALAKGGSLPRRLVYVSTSGVYGDCQGERIDETRTCAPKNARARRRVEAERQLRRFAARCGVRLAILRVPGIYGPGRMPLERLVRGTPAVNDGEDSYTNHIHIEDLAKAIWLALYRARPSRVYHVVDDSEMKMGQYFDAVAERAGLPKPPRVARSEAQAVLSPALLSFLNESRRLANGRLKQELRVRLSYPTVADGLAGWDPRGDEIQRR